MGIAAQFGREVDDVLQTDDIVAVWFCTDMHVKAAWQDVKNKKLLNYSFSLKTFTPGNSRRSTISDCSVPLQMS